MRKTKKRTLLVRETLRNVEGAGTTSDRCIGDAGGGYNGAVTLGCVAPIGYVYQYDPILRSYKLVRA
jgi:hypothetical protein